MKQTTLNEFLALPPGTVFSFWEPAVADGLHVKGETIVSNIGDGPFSNDFYYLPLLPTATETCAPSLDLTPTLETLLHRWGLYEDEQLFAVYEPEDVLELIRRLGGGTPHVTEK